MTRPNLTRFSVLSMALIASFALVIGVGLGVAGAGLWRDRFTNDAPSVFTASDASGSTALLWADNGDGTLTGSITTAVGSGTPTTGSFTGTLHNHQISLVFPHPGDGPTTWVGTLTGDTLIFEIPNANGPINEVVYTRVDPHQVHGA